ncbi:hypothetical protein CH1034_90022 [Klebsiella pneumoniae]|nr:hypothetical protein CH1034_90022 [Klebsiella pneumoniae]
MNCATHKSICYFHNLILFTLSRLTAGGKKSFCPYGRYLKTKYSLLLLYLNRLSDSYLVNFTVCKTRVII